MAFEFLKKLLGQSKQDYSCQDQVESVSIPLQYNEIGLFYPKNSPQNTSDYLWQGLNQEGLAYLDENSQSYILTWENIFDLQQDEDYQDILPLLQLPQNCNFSPSIQSKNSISDRDFSIFISGWNNQQGGALQANIQRQGAILTVNGQKYLLAEKTWQLVEEIKAFSQLSDKTRQENERYWGKIRKLAIQSQAKMDDFLDKTIVLSPEKLQLNLSPIQLDDQQGVEEKGIEIQPIFEDVPENWLKEFDKYHQVQGRYAVSLSNGGQVHIVVEDTVKQALNEIKQIPKRQLKGERARQFIKNPQAIFSDEDIAKVIDEADLEQQISQQTEFLDYDLTLNSQYNEQGYFQSAKIVLQANTEQDVSDIYSDLYHVDHANDFISKYIDATQQDSLTFDWVGYHIRLTQNAKQQLEQLKADLDSIHKQQDAEIVNAILDLSAYSDRVQGIGIAPTDSIFNSASGEIWLPISRQIQQFESLKPHISETILTEIQTELKIAIEQKQNQVKLPYLDEAISLADAKDIEIRVQDYLAKQKSPTEKQEQMPVEPPEKREKPSILLIKSNLEDEEYIQEREKVLKFDFKNSPLPRLPDSFRQREFKLKPHQEKGIAWLQHLHQFVPVINGCLLADDMGLGKTLQLLCFIGEYLQSEQYRQYKKPVMIVAPVALLQNWRNEAERFFSRDFGRILSLYGNEVKSRKMKNIPLDLIQEKGIKHILEKNWCDDADVVLTTYETLRDLQFSLGQQHWGMMICDEAQKIKTPNALVTSAAKAMKVDFKIACTGTPVENSLRDIWCLFDFIQAGLLDSLKTFNKVYATPIGEGDEKKRKALLQLIEPQTLRRMKSDVADLPAKIEMEDCKRIPISILQRRLYENMTSEYENIGDENRGQAMLSALHEMRKICADPLQIDPKQPSSESPKLAWLKQTLEQIKSRDEKVIIFTELRAIQIYLQRYLKEYFGLDVSVVNGDTASSGTGLTRQHLIDALQKSIGFNVIIMSPVAVGFGVNVQKANHVIHYTRCWNPAKEDQATDRAYRIGQEKEVFVYYPSIYSAEFETFEIKLDRLLQNKRQLATDLLSPMQDVSANELLSTTIQNDYVAEWDNISRNIREEQDWVCAECQLQLKQSSLKRFLHVHHLNCNKTDNRPENLRVLCIKCHAEQAGHQHLKNSPHYHEFIQLINAE